MSIAYHTHLVLEVHLGSSLGVMILHHTIYSNVLLASGQDALSCPANKAAKVHTYFLASEARPVRSGERSDRTLSLAVLAFTSCLSHVACFERLAVYML
jgi:hypothetical protein